MDMEWAKDDLDGKLYLVYARPETVVSQRGPTMLESYVARAKPGAGRGVTRRLSCSASKAARPAAAFVNGGCRQAPACL